MDARGQRWALEPSGVTLMACQRWESGPLPRETHPAAQKMRPRTNAPRAHASVNGIGCASASCTAMLTTPMPLTMCQVLCGSTRGKCPVGPLLE